MKAACAVPNCKQARLRGPLCRDHNQRMMRCAMELGVSIYSLTDDMKVRLAVRGGPLKNFERMCCITGCLNHVKITGLCGLHWYQVQRVAKLSDMDVGDVPKEELESYVREFSNARNANRRSSRQREDDVSD